MSEVDKTARWYKNEKAKFSPLLLQDGNQNDIEDDDTVESSESEENHNIQLSITNHAIQNVRLKKGRVLPKARSLKTEVFLAIAACLLFIVLCVAALSVALLDHGDTKPRYNTTRDWTKVFHNRDSESCVRLFDVDGDGRDDVIVGMITVENVEEAMEVTRNRMEEYCQSINATSPCLGELVALRGYDGELLWSLPVYGNIFELNCGNIDVNKDGAMDCIGAGRLGTCFAFDPRNGTILWGEDLSATMERWNTYNLLVLADFSGDGVPEVLLNNGGNPMYPPDVVNRQAAHLLLLDGATGKKFSKRVLEMRDSEGDKESYMSPVLHTMPDGSAYILYASGGESVPGSLMLLSLADFYRYVMELSKEQPLPKTLTGKYEDFKKVALPKTPEGAFILYTSQSLGVLVPPVLIDVDLDGVNDILMVAHDGTIILFNGKTLGTIWTKQYAGFESYSTPAPGYLDDDETIDFMLHLNKGSWAGGYNYSLTVALDSLSGEQLFRVIDPYYQMSSDLVVSSTESHRHVFLFRGHSGERNLSGALLSPANRSSDQDYPYYDGRHDYTSYEDDTVEDYYVAEDNLTTVYGDYMAGDEQAMTNGKMTEFHPDPQPISRSSYDCHSKQSSKCNLQLFAVDKTMLASPLSIANLACSPVFYTENSKDNLQENDGDPETLCTLLTSSERTTGAIGDVDGDGNLDIVIPLAESGFRHDKIGNDLDKISHVRVVRISLQSALQTAKPSQNLNVRVVPNAHVPQKKGPEHTLLQNLTLRTDQTWSAYMGAHCDSIYKYQP